MEYRNKLNKPRIAKIEDLTKVLTNEDYLRQIDFIIQLKKELTCYQN
jgi:hypothetical protein